MRPILLFLLLTATLAASSCEFLFSYACGDQKQTYMDCSTENPPLLARAPKPAP